MNDTGRVVPIPHLSADEIQILLHGLRRLGADFDINRHLDTFMPTEIRPIVNSLTTALLEALTDARRIVDVDDQGRTEEERAAITRQNLRTPQPDR